MAEPAAMSEDMSLEETNYIFTRAAPNSLLTDTFFPRSKLRISLGLPPLAVDSEGAINHEEQAHENWANYRNEKAKEAKEKEIKERIEKSKNRKKLAEKLKGKALGEASDDEDESALNWIKKSRKREKELAAKRAKELAEMDETFEKGGAEYSAGM
ncbi:SART-1 family-domain-containing protein [Jimgerdemannia flammicorona]|uniref:SART-1 family-domain-containing protein n=2 Tax=Jimgerdemannia flammicorona TaxID=994334 RepID=A0A433QGW1_9FUNG|nr:SART-1 family-domain-containing protein [Jimgerdemannia flammicorona]RUS29060.1 SART-1 family-domain-containing protein [Jimgerdemannia flammicorona]